MGTTSGYVVKKPITQYLEPDLTNFKPQVKEEILEFFEYWARKLEKIEPAILSFIQKRRN